MKKLLILSTILISSSLFSQQYTVHVGNTNSKITDNIVVDSPYNASGFHNSTGIHRDTGTEYDPEGFDQNGYGQEICLTYNRYNATVEHVVNSNSSEIYSFI